MNRSKLVASGLLLAVFVAGLIVGGTASALADRNETESRRPRRPYEEVLQEKLNLTAEQRESIEVILQQWRSGVHELWDERGRKLEEIRRGTRAEIVGALDERQVEVYREMISRDDSIRAERANRRHK